MGSILGLIFVSLITVAVYRMVIKKKRKKTGHIYTPFDDVINSKKSSAEINNNDEHKEYNTYQKEK